MTHYEPPRVPEIVRTPPRSIVIPPPRPITSPRVHVTLPQRHVVVFDEEHARDFPMCLESKTRFNQTNFNHLFCTDFLHAK